MNLTANLLIQLLFAKGEVDNDTHFKNSSSPLVRKSVYSVFHSKIFYLFTHTNLFLATHG